MGVSKTQIQQIHCSSEVIRKAIQETAIPMQSKLKTPGAHNPELDQSVYDWFCNMRNPHNRCKPLPVSSAAMQVRAKREAQLRMISKFNASYGWLARWRWRYGVGKSVCLHGEAADVDLEAAEKEMQSLRDISLWREDMPQITSSTWMRLGSSIFVCLGAADGCDSRQVGRGMKSLKTKDRVTLVLCLNAIGSFKIPPLMIY